MSAPAGARPLALAAVALVAALAALATERRVDPPATRPAVLLPLDGAWEQAGGAPLAGTARIGGCGFAIGPETLAVAHPTLPCGLRIVVEVGAATASVQVAGRAPLEPGTSFGLSPALARELGVSAPRVLRWALAARAG